MPDTTAPTAFAPGQILVSEWGHEQTNADFYMILRKTATQVVLQKLKARTLEVVQSMTGRSAPMPDETDGKPFRRKVILCRGERFVMITDFAYAYPMEVGQKSVRVSSYG